MKNTLKFATVLVSILLIGSAFVLTSETSSPEQVQDTDKIEIAGEVKEIIEAKCMGCHKPDSRNQKAKDKLQWAKVPELDKEGQEDLIKELFEVLEEGKMPPKRALERRPQMKLTEEETKTLLAWAEKEEKRLKGE